LLPDLGKYAEAVLSAYAASIVLLVGIVALSLWRGRRVRAEMRDVERRSKRDG
jgi:heme exporter protein D